MRRVAVVLTALLACACTDFGITVTDPAPPIPDPPRPGPLPGENATALEETHVPGLFRAEGVVAPLYYYEPRDIWYQYYKGRWHQAFSWNGHWFEPDRLPQQLRDKRLIEGER